MSSYLRRSSGLGFSFAPARFAAALGLVACSSQPAGSASNEDAASAGTLRVALTASSHGREYRLRDAKFSIQGPSALVLDSEANRDAATLAAELFAGDYTAELGGQWFLERRDANAAVPVRATLASANPVAFHIAADATTALPFRFATDQVELMLGKGTLEISTEVSERGLSLLVGQLGGLGSGDGVGHDGRFFEPMGVVSDGAGNLYVADTYNDTIRRVALGTLEVSTVVGAASLFGTADGIGADARFYAPRGICLDDAGSLYVTDRYNRTVRRVVLSSREVTTLAGTPGVYGSMDGVGPDASFSDPTALACDGGNVYVTDDNVIRKIVVATAEVSTLAGLESDPFGSSDGIGSEARFATPHGIAADHHGNLFVADTNNQTIRRIEIATAEVTTIAGQAHESGNSDGPLTAARFSQPAGIAVDAEGRLFVADSANWSVRVISFDAGTVTTLAGGSLYGASDGVGAAARFSYPEALTTDGAGNVWVADSGNDSMRKVEIGSGQVTTPVGALFPSPEFSDGVGAAVGLGFVPSMASDGAGAVYLANGEVIRKLDVASAAVTTIAGVLHESDIVDGSHSVARFRGARSLVLENGSLYLCDGDTIRRLDLATGEAQTIAGNSGVVGYADGVGTAATFDTPISLTSDGAGHLYVSDFFNGLIRRVDIATAQVTTIAGTLRAYGIVDGVGSGASFWSPYAVVHDGANSLYIMDGATLRRLDLDTNAVTTVAGSATADTFSVDGVGLDARFSLANGLARDDAGNLFVADTQGHAVRKVELSTMRVTTVVGTPAASGVLLGSLPGRLTLPQSVVVLPDQSLLIADEAALLLATF